MTVKLVKRVLSSRYIYGVSILVTLNMNKEECYAQLNHDYTSNQVVQSHKIQVWVYVAGDGGSAVLS